MGETKIPVGRSGFADIRRNGYYYIDKTNLIAELLRTEAAQVTLITRPRRFGKTLNMSMLAEFFDIRRDSREAFRGLAVASKEELCGKWMNQYPTLFLSFKSVGGMDFSRAYSKLKAVMAQLYQEHLELLESPRVNPYEKKVFDQIASKTADQETVENGLLTLTRMLAAHYGRPAVLLIDEYDVPLAKAGEKGYYPEMLEVVRGLMQAIKDNDALKFAVVTGCLRTAKESIFTDTNNFVSDTISDTRLDEYFGFTQPEVDRLLRDTGLDAYAAAVKEWYDGYHFGGFDVYCPWDVMNYVNSLTLDRGAEPKNFWENTSGNSIIRSFLSHTDFDVKDKFEALLAGKYVKEYITDNLTYGMLESSEENLWSLLYFTGYLTGMRPDEMKEDSLMPGQYALKIPNEEIKGIFKKSVKAWLMEKSGDSSRGEFFGALWSGDAGKLTVILSDLLFDTISYHDYRESFYHAFLVGLVSNAGYQVESNYETGLGRSDIAVKDRHGRRAVVIEAKWAESETDLPRECDMALRQIEERQYARKLEREGFKSVGRLAVAFFQKRCMVKAESEG